MDTPEATTPTYYYVTHTKHDDNGYKERIVTGFHLNEALAISEAVTKFGSQGIFDWPYLKKRGCCIRKTTKYHFSQRVAGEKRKRDVFETLLQDFPKDAKKIRYAVVSFDHGVTGPWRESRDKAISSFLEIRGNEVCSEWNDFCRRGFSYEMAHDVEEFEKKVEEQRGKVEQVSKEHEQFVHDIEKRVVTTHPLE